MTRNPSPYSWPRHPFVVPPSGGRLHWRAFAAVFLLSLALAPAALAQREPRAGYAYPAGGRQGAAIDVVIGGQYLNGVTDAYISGTGVDAVVFLSERQLTPKEQEDAKEKLARLQDKKAQGRYLTASEEKSLAELMRTLTMFGRRLSNPALSEFVTLHVTLAANAEPGRREIRLESPLGLTNPVAFYVGRLPEVTKSEWKNVPKARSGMDSAMPEQADVRFTPPCVLNGQIPPGGVDRYRFPARAGQQLVVDVSARDILPYLADAVPGWFQATLTLYDAKGKEVAYNDDYRFHPDPVLFYKIPENGDYVLEIRDSLFRGREDFVYRVTVGEQPFVTGIFPLGGQAGTQPTLALRGWNLTAKQLTPDLRKHEPGILTLSAGPTSNRVPFAVDTLTECLEVEPNGPAAPQKITLPIIINGRIDKPGDWDVFSFSGDQGNQVVVEVFARRLDSPLDSTLKLTDSEGKQLAVNDDHEDKGSGLNTHHADSYLTATLPADDLYSVHVGDTQRGGGWAYAYRLRISAPRPDFELRIAPSSLTVRTGASVPMTAYALRRDGFAGDIDLSLKDAPAGFNLTAARIPAGQDLLKLTLSPPGSAPPAPIDLILEGRAVIQDREIVRQAIPADDRMQAFAYRHLVPAQELKVSVLGRNRGGEAAKIISPTPARIPAGGTARIRISVPVGPFMSDVQFDLSEPPEGISLKESSLTELVLVADATKVKPGQKGNLIVKVSAERPMPAAAKTATPAKRRVPIGALPAIPFEITAR